MILQELKGGTQCYSDFHELQVGAAWDDYTDYITLWSETETESLIISHNAHFKGYSPGLQLLVVDGVGLLKLDGKLLHGGVQRLLVAREIGRDGVVEK